MSSKAKDCGYFLDLLDKAHDPNQPVDMDFLLFHLNTCMDCHAKVLLRDGSGWAEASIIPGEERWHSGDNQGQAFVRFRTLIKFS